VGDDHDRDVALPVQLTQEADDLLLVAQVEVGQRLVEEQQLGVVDDRLGDGHPLLLPAGELGHPPVGVVGGPDPRQGLVDPGTLGRRRPPEPEPAAGEAEGDQVAAADGLAECGGVVLRHVADPAVPPPGRRPQDLHPPGGRGQQAQGELEHRGLARPVGADDADDGARADGERAL
jgi:hypothetical protein